MKCETCGKPWEHAVLWGYNCAGEARPCPSPWLTPACLCDLFASSGNENMGEAFQDDTMDMVAKTFKRMLGVRE